MRTDAFDDSIEHIAIVGCGFTGVSAFHQLISRYHVREITIFESTGEYGPGYAYRPDECTDYLLNNTTDTMCLGPDNKRAFLDWLENHPEVNADLSPKGHLPRRLYGLFLKDVVKVTAQRARELGVICNFFSETVTAVEEKSINRVRISWPNGAVEADAVIMATGRCPDVEIVQTPTSDMTANYYDTQVSNNNLDQIALNADVHILGASLSAYDVINRLFSEQTGCRFEQHPTDGLRYVPGPNERHVTLYSRSGRLKKIQSRLPQRIHRAAFTLPVLRDQTGTSALTMRNIADSIASDGAAHGADFDTTRIENPYQGCFSPDDVNKRAGEILASDIAAAKQGCGANFLVDVLDDAQLDLWDGFAERLLPANEEHQYRQAVETALLTYAAPCPIPTAERILALHRAGRLRVVCGVKTPVLLESGDGFKVEHAYGEAKVSTLINATGKVDRDICSAVQPTWIQTLVDEGKLRRYAREGFQLAGAEIDMSTFRPPGLNCTYFANMYLWGPGFFTSSAFIMANVVSRILDHIFSPKAQCT